MADAPRTRNWKAWEDRLPGPGMGIALYVTGEVETGNSNQAPHLREAVPQGMNPTILILALSTIESGVGKPVVGWQPVRFEKKMTRDQYVSIDILWERESIATCKVEIVH